MYKSNTYSNQLLKMRRVVEETILYFIQEKKSHYDSIWKHIHTESCQAFLKLKDLWVAKLKEEAQEAKCNAAHSENVVTGLKAQESFSRHRKRRSSNSRRRKLMPYSKSSDYRNYRVVEEETDIDIGRGLAILFGVIKLGGIDGNISTR